MIVVDHDLPTMSDSYRTVMAPLEYEPEKTKGSRHIATVLPVHDRADIEAGLDAVAARMRDASHHAYAWRLGRGRDDFRYGDGGEPSGSAGRPILQQIDGRGLTDVLVVVSRYFGGTKLGVGGLVRAYGGAAAAALDRADIREVVPEATVLLRHAYADSGAIAAVLSAFDLRPVHAAYGENIEVEIRVEQARATGFTNAVRDATAGRATIECRPSDRANPG